MSIPAEGRPLIYQIDGRDYVGQWLGRCVDPPKQRRGQPALWILPGPTGWVMAEDGLVLVARINRVWRAVTIPGLPDPEAALATKHRPATKTEKDMLW